MTHDGDHQTTPSRQGLRILLTNNTLDIRAGSELFLRDLAIALMKRGHFPVAYSRALGDVANELSLATIPVIDDLERLGTPPDIIHGQHHLEAVTAVMRFPLTPALFVCHGWRPWEEEPPVMPSIRHYVAVDNLCRERVIATRGISADDVSVIPNFVDLTRFPQRGEWRDQPRSALIFSNYAKPDDLRTAAIRAACRRAGIAQVDILGLGAGHVHPDPGQILRNYDIVFAKARCALEAMAAGAAVIVTDYAGLAGLVTSDNVAQLRAWNFGARTMQATAVTEDNIVRELQRYNAADAQSVSDFIRSEAGLEQTADRWLTVYDHVLGKHVAPAGNDATAFLLKQTVAASHYLNDVSRLVKGHHVAETNAQLADIAKAEAIAANAVLSQNLAKACAGIHEYKSPAVGEQEPDENQLSELTGRIAALQTELEAHKDTLAAIRGSRAWRAVTRYGSIKKRLFRSSARPLRPFPIIVGVPRSGTTLLRLMLDSHPQLAIPPETAFLISPRILEAGSDAGECARLLTSYPFEAPGWHDFGIDTDEFIQAAHKLPSNAGLSGVLRLFYARYAARQRKPRSGDKTPIYLLHMGAVASVLPEAHFIHIVRDGRDVALSWSKTWFAPTKSLPDLVARWASDITAARAVAPMLKYLEVRYEDLIKQPETVLRSICTFIDLDYSPDMLNYHLRAPERLDEHQERRLLNGDLLVSRQERLNQQWRTTLPPQHDRIGVWRAQMSADDKALCQSASAGLLKDT